MLLHTLVYDPRVCHMTVKRGPIAKEKIQSNLSFVTLQGTREIRSHKTGGH